MLAGLAASFVFVVAAAQLTGLLLHGLSRSRRLHDLSLFLGLLLGFALSLVPILLRERRRPSAAGRAPGGCSRPTCSRWSPFAWGLRAAVHVGPRRGRERPWPGAPRRLRPSSRCLGACGLLIDRIYRGELDLGGAAADVSRAAGAHVVRRGRGQRAREGHALGLARPRPQGHPADGAREPAAVPVLPVPRGLLRRLGRRAADGGGHDRRLELRRQRVRLRAPRPLAAALLPGRALAPAARQEPGLGRVPAAGRPHAADRGRC